MGNEIDRVRLREACAFAQILDFAEAQLPDGFDRNVGGRGICLSGSQRKRIGLASALYHRPSLLILDEATRALDVATEVKRHCAVLRVSLLWFVAAHRPSALANCDQLIDLSNEVPSVAVAAKSMC
jgi:ATP-binding cassette, subfamily B, bacterial PglK